MPHASRMRGARSAMADLLATPGTLRHRGRERLRAGARGRPERAEILTLAVAPQARRHGNRLRADASRRRAGPPPGCPCPVPRSGGGHRAAPRAL
ncbi:MAG: hypothetical protein WDM81_00685 [Rhizomicrobium sp.]